MSSENIDLPGEIIALHAIKNLLECINPAIEQLNKGLEKKKMATRTIVEAVAEKSIENMCDDCHIEGCKGKCDNIKWVHKNIMRCAEEK